MLKFAPTNPTPCKATVTNNWEIRGEDIYIRGKYWGEIISSVEKGGVIKVVFRDTLRRERNLTLIK